MAGYFSTDYFATDYFASDYWSGLLPSSSSATPFKPYVTHTGLGIGQEIEIEIMETDSVDLLLTNIDLTIRGLKR